MNEEDPVTIATLPAADPVAIAPTTLNGKLPRWEKDPHLKVFQARRDEAERDLSHARRDLSQAQAASAAAREAFDEGELQHFAGALAKEKVDRLAATLAVADEKSAQRRSRRAGAVEACRRLAA